MHKLALLSAVLLASCGSSAPLPEPVGLATQEVAPAPDYRALILPPERLHTDDEMERPATASAPADAKEVGDVWIGRLEARHALMGSGLAGKGEHDPVAMIDTLLTAREFDAWVAANGWQVPRHIDWRFQQELRHPALAPDSSGAVRLWPAFSIRTGWRLEAAFTGRISLRDGCVFVSQPGEGEALAWFHAETGLGRDGEGFYTLVNRVTGETMARLGEEMQWAGPNTVDPAQPAVAALRAACGELEVVGVGNPEALERIYVRYPHLRQVTIPSPPPPADSGD
ncbi:MAG: hypothetical protein ABIT10_09630 [Alteraurantiacibacter sp.]